MSSGKVVESHIQQLCERLFFPDFTVRSPLFSKTRGREKEAADVLVPFGDRLLIFQIKTKQETKPASEKTETDFERIGRRVDEAIGQVKTAINAIKNQRFEKLTTARGLEIPFDSTAQLVNQQLTWWPRAESNCRHLDFSVCSAWISVARI